jgi:hypothetical protein
MQMFKYNIAGFLHWGYNFYNNSESFDLINPYIDVCGEKWVPAGDAFSVYPGRFGECLESLRLLVFQEGINDMRAMQLCEALYSHDEVIAAIENALGYSISFDRCAKSANEILRMREVVNVMINKKFESISSTP